MSRPSALSTNSISAERALTSNAAKDCVLYLLTENELRQINGPIEASDYGSPSIHENGEASMNASPNPLERSNDGQDNIAYMLTAEELRRINGAITGHNAASSAGSSSSTAEITTFLDQYPERLDEQAQTSRPKTSRWDSRVRSLHNSHIHLMYRYVREHRDLLEVKKKLKAWA
ncbi:hypothetical protein BGZ72_011138, partial [Mortierella alpina]